MKPKVAKIEKCLVCEHTNLEPLLFFYSQYLPRLFHRVAICKDCGHIQLYPLLDEKMLTSINNRVIGSKYIFQNQQNLVDNSRKLQQLDQRLSKYLRSELNVLDVGAGQAWAMDYFRQRNCNYFAIELVPRLAELIQERGGRVIGRTILDDYSGYTSYFDIIVLRHILEHIVNPKEVLRILGTMLSANGIIYLVLPNTRNPSDDVRFKNVSKKGFRTSFMRPNHISYFCEQNVHYLARSVGLTPLLSEADVEIFCLLRHGGNNHVTQLNYYTQQKEVFLSLARMTLFSDSVKVAKDLSKIVVKRMFKKNT